MKKAIISLTALALITGAMLTSCTSSSEKVVNAQENVDQANKDLDQAKQEYLADVENYRQESAARIAANEESIKEFNAEMVKDKRAATADRKKKVAALEQKNREMKMRMENFKEDGKDKWLTFKTEFNHDMDEMGKAFKDLTVNNVK